MTGTGAYFYIQWGIWLRHCLNGKQVTHSQGYEDQHKLTLETKDEYELVWPRLVTSLPTVVRRKALPANGLSRKDI
jgi:dihydroceramidase